MVLCGSSTQQLFACSNQNSVMSTEEMDQKFKEMRIKQSSNPKSQTFFEIIKAYFKNEQEMCDWILNVWKYAKFMLHDDLCKKYMYANLELIKDHRNNEEWISCEFLLEHLVTNDPSFYDFEVFFDPKNLLQSKILIYDIIK